MRHIAQQRRNLNFPLGKIFELRQYGQLYEPLGITIFCRTFLHVLMLEIESMDVENEIFMLQQDNHRRGGILPNNGISTATSGVNRLEDCGMQNNFFYGKTNNISTDNFFFY